MRPDFRKRRFDTFLRLMEVSPESRILDVGGAPDTWRGTGLERQVTLLNLQNPREEMLRPGFGYVQGDARDMHMFGARSFDIVFSNSVIEHVGTFGDQKRMASEIRRVGGRYWVQTPSRYFPLEPHLMFPFFQFLPVRIQKQIALRWKYSHLKKWNLSPARILEECARIRLLTPAEMRELFRDGRLIKERVFGWTKSLVACRMQDADV